MHSFLEGPSFDLDVNLYCVDVAYGRIFTISTNGVFNVVAEYDGWPNGLKIDKAGKIFIADYKHGIMQLDPKTGQVSVVLERYRAERFKGVNDLVFASNGDMYFTDQGLTGLQDPSGRVFRYPVGGPLDCILDNIPSPNGLVLSKDESTLYLAVTRANAVWRVPLIPDGGVSKVGVYIQMSGGAGPDGMALDLEGGIVVAHVGFGAVWHFSSRGEPISRIESCEGLLTTNGAFGGTNNCDLYITESETGTILRAQLNVPGHNMYSHM
jgi:gluconolactonase